MNRTKPKTAVLYPRTISLAGLVNAPWNVHRKSRKDDEDFRGLVQSIKANGMIHRIVVRPIAGAKWEIVDGHRRAEAARAAGMQDVECDAAMDGLSDEAAQAITCTANRQRLENDPLLESALIARLAAAGKTHREIAAAIGIGEAKVARRERLCNLTEKWRGWLERNDAPAAFMEMVAAHEQSLQDEVFDALAIEGGEGEIDEDEVERAFKRRLMRLDEEVPFDREACRSCPFNTANHGFLFPPEEDEDCEGRCEREACYRRKWNETVDRRIEALRKKKVAVKEARQKWDVPNSWSAAKNRSKKNSEPWVYEEDGLKRLVWAEPRQSLRDAAPAKTEAEKAEEKRVKAAHKAWAKNRSSAFSKVRELLGDTAKAEAAAGMLVNSSRWLEARRDDVVKAFVGGYAYDAKVQEMLDFVAPASLAALGLALDEDEKRALSEEDPENQLHEAEAEAEEGDAE